jgi:hypothetical protein
MASVREHSDPTLEASLVDKIVCPHCWHEFPPEQLHFIATSPELSFDHVVPGGAPRRFLPSQFTFQGDAIDPAGGVCTETACPSCHLKVPRLLAQRKIISVSIFGAPGSGKSYLLAAMTHRIAQVLHEYGLSIDDVDAEANVILHEYEKELFHQPTADTRVQLKKTDIAGAGSEWYSTVNWRGRSRLLPKPFLFRLDAIARAQNPGTADRVLCLYDNAGESFEPGGETEDNPVTRHMSRADGLIFVFDPTKETAFRRACQARSNDPQWSDQRMSRQSALFSEAISRILRYRGLLPTDRIDTPLIVLLPKFDAWSFLLTDQSLPAFWASTETTDANGSPTSKRFDARAVLAVSQQVRKMLQAHATPLLTRIESTCNPQKVLYLPVSATGCSPKFDSRAHTTAEGVTASLDDLPNSELDLADVALADAPASELSENYFRAGDISPIWAEVPALTLLRMIAPKLLPAVTK